MLNFLSKIKSSSLIKDTAKLASSNVLLYIIPFIVTPILSRLYDPSFFGEWGVFSSTYQIINCILFLCYDYAIIKAQEDEYPCVCGLSFIVSLLIIIIVVVLFLAGEALGYSFFEGFPEKYNLFIFLLFTSVSHILLAVANRQKRYWLMSSASITLGVLQALIRILFGIYFIFPNGLIAGTTIAQFLTMILLCFYIKNTINISFFKSINLDGIVSVAKKYKKFPLYDAPAMLLLFCTFNLSLIILSFHFNIDDIGCLSIIHQMLLLPISLVGSAMGKVYYKQISEIKSDMHQTEVQTSTKMIKLVLVMALLPALFISLGGDYLINLFLGSKWQNAGNIAICLAIWSIPNILTQPLIPIFRKRNKQNIMLITYMINFILGIGSIILSCYFYMNIYSVLIIYATCSAMTNYALFFYILKLADVSLRKTCNPLLITFHVLLIVLIFYRFNNIG